MALPPARAATASPTPVRRAARSAILRPLRASMARVGLRIADLAVRRTAFGLTMAARAGGCGRPQCFSTGYPRGRRSEAVGEAREVARRRAAASLRTLPRTRSTGGELSVSARPLAAFHRFSADRRTAPAPAAAPAVFAAGLCACVRCRACVCCAARPLTSGCIVTCVWSRMCDDGATEEMTGCADIRPGRPRSAPM